MLKFTIFGLSAAANYALAAGIGALSGAALLKGVQKLTEKKDETVTTEVHTKRAAHSHA